MTIIFALNEIALLILFMFFQHSIYLVAISKHICKPFLQYYTKYFKPFV